MKILLAAVLLMVSHISFAQQGFDMGNMMEKMEAMQQCMAEVDQSKLQQYQVEGDKFANEVRNLCNAGKRQQAQNRAMQYAMTIRDSAELKKIRECIALMEGMPGMPQPKDFAKLASDAQQKHVCDAF